VFQHIEETRCGTFEPKLAAERKVSSERDGLDASKACHISARGNVRSALNACRSNKRSAEHLFERFRGLLSSAEPSCSFSEKRRTTVHDYTARRTYQVVDLKGKCMLRKSDAWSFSRPTKRPFYSHLRVWLGIGPAYGAESAD
jgi:hypothetical protein